MAKKGYKRCDVVYYNKYTDVIKFDYMGRIIQTVSRLGIQNPKFVYARVEFAEDGTVTQLALHK